MISKIAETLKTKWKPLPLVKQNLSWLSLLFLAGAIIGLAMYMQIAQNGVGGDGLQYYNSAVNHYENLDRRAAVYWFERASVSDTQDQIRNQALYNLGTLLAYGALSAGTIPRDRIELLELATEKLQRSVLLNPKDEDAKYNLELLQRLLEELLEEAQPGGDEKPGGGPEYGPGDNPSRGF